MLNPKMRQAFALAQAVQYRKNKRAIVHKLAKALCEAINQDGERNNEDNGQCSIARNQSGDPHVFRQR